MTGDGDGSGGGVTRRHYLGVLGATTAAVAVGASQTGSANEHGYGVGAYGEGAYGGDESTDGSSTDDTVSLGVETVGADDVATDSATLVGAVTELENASSASTRFEWGESGAGYPNATAEQSVSGTGEFEATLSGLDADTDYAFRAVATADGTTSTGGESVLQTDTNDEPTEGTPEIGRLTGADVSNPRNPHVDAEIEWAADIDASELYAATLTLSDSNGEIESWSYSLSGETASATETRRIPYHERTEDATYTVDLVVYSYYGNIDQKTTTFEQQ